MELQRSRSEMPVSAATPAATASRDSVGPRPGSVRCMSKSGFHRIAYVEWGDPNSERVAFCVHGLTRQGRDFDPLAVALARKGYRVVCPDLVGRGRSEWLHNPEEYELPQYVSDMATVIGSLKVKSIDYIGTSLGGLTGIQLASKLNTPIRRMVINDIGALLPWQALFRLGEYVQKMPKRFGNFFSAEAYFREILAPFGTLGDSEWYHLTKYSIARDDDGKFRMLIDPGIARGVRAVPFYNVSFWREWDDIKCPVLLLRGQHSDLLPEDVAVQMTRRGPRASFVEFPGCGHAPALMDHRQCGTIISWLMREPEAGLA
jgi:pimeloyl-ACP methyl ester carboxylesterase